jgi:hypothetical protein
MNEANKAVRAAVHDVVVEILGVLGVQPQEMDSNFGEGAGGTAIELRLLQLAGAILEQVQPMPLLQTVPEQPDSGKVTPQA